MTGRSLSPSASPHSRADGADKGANRLDQNKVGRRQLLVGGAAVFGSALLPARALAQPGMPETRFPTDEVWAKSVPGFGRASRMIGYRSSRFAAIYDRTRYWIFDRFSGEFAAPAPLPFAPGFNVSTAQANQLGFIYGGSDEREMPAMGFIPWPDQGLAPVRNSTVNGATADPRYKGAITAIDAQTYGYDPRSSKRTRLGQVYLGAYQPAANDMMVLRAAISDLDYLAYRETASAMEPVSLLRIRPKGVCLGMIRFGSQMVLINYDAGTPTRSRQVTSRTGEVFDDSFATQGSLAYLTSEKCLVIGTRPGKLGLSAKAHSIDSSYDMFDAQPDPDFQPVGQRLTLSSERNPKLLHVSVSDGRAIRLFELSSRGHSFTLKDTLRWVASSQIPGRAMPRDISYFGAKSADADKGMVLTAWNGSALWLQRREHTAAAGAVLFG